MTRTEEVRLSSKSQIVIPKRIREALGLRPGDRVRFEVLQGRRAVLRAATAAPEEVFVSAGGKIIQEALGKAKKVDELKISKLLRSLGVAD